MQITISRENVFWLIDELLARWRSNPKKYPFNRPDAIIPQDLIPDTLRADQRTMANWYLAVCNHMKGRVNSVQAFLAYIKIWENEPQFFDPLWVVLQDKQTVENIYDRYIATDKKACTRAHILNSRRLRESYKGDASNILKNAKSYDDALLRMLNKQTKAERLSSRGDPGFFGFRHKMVSMFVYFVDWEGFIKNRFPYPAPADIQNFRVGIASQGIQIANPSDRGIRNHETISAPWRKVVLEYIIERDEDPIDVADVLWLFSNVMCGNSPLTTTLSRKNDENLLFKSEDAPVSELVSAFTKPRHLIALQQTCLNCFLLDRCKYAIPAEPYYESGVIELRKRPHVETMIPKHIVTEPKFDSPDLPKDPELIFPR